MGLFNIKAKITGLKKYDKILKAHLPNVMNVAAATMQTNRGMLFKNGGAYNGHEAWKSLSFRNGMPLSDRGTLKRSIAPNNNGEKPGSSKDGIVRISGLQVTVGTKLIYARLMNYGGVVKAKKAKALKIPLPSGKAATAVAKTLSKGAVKIDNKKFIFRKSVTIPGRDYISWNAQDQEDLTAAVKSYIVRKVFK